MKAEQAFERDMSQLEADVRALESQPFELPPINVPNSNTFQSNVSGLELQIRELERILSDTQ
ncbi:MAG: hypothetical protein R3C03_07705 [Pirellulaceae bacterium]